MCIYMGAHTHSLRLVRDYPSQAAVNTDKYSIRPILPTALRELWQAQCFPPSCERPGVFSALWGAWVLMPQVPAVHGLAAAPRENWRGVTPSPAPSSLPIHPSMLCPLGMLQETGV